MQYDSFGELFKSLRLRKGVTLRKFCETFGLDPGNISKMERGMIPPPAGREKLEEYAAHLDLVPQSSEWYSFFDLAAVASGRIPADLMSDEELLTKLPMVFRTMRAERISDEDIDNLISIIRKA